VYNSSINVKKGDAMERMTIKNYATRNKLSIFNVVKMVKSGALRSEVVEEDGKEVTYILTEASQPTSPQQEEKTLSEKREEKRDLAEKVARLEQDVGILKRELDALKMSMGIRS
jgi:hypothetical protein